MMCYYKIVVIFVDGIGLEVILVGIEVLYVLMCYDL